MTRQSLIVSRDPEILAALCPLLHELDISMELCLGTAGAIQLTHARKFDTVIVDCDDDVGLTFLTQLRHRQPNRKTIAVGIIRNSKSMQAAFDCGATFVLTKPLPVEDARRIFRISKGLMNGMVRRFLRLPVNTLTYCDIGANTEAFLLDLCQGGASLQASDLLSAGQQVNLSFQLPKSTARIEDTAQVVWTDISGRAGIEFRNLTSEAREDLNDWIFTAARKRPTAVN